MSANQRLYQAEQTSATAVANAAQLQGEVLRLSNQMDELSLDLQTQSSLAETQQVCSLQRRILQPITGERAPLVTAPLLISVRPAQTHWSAA